MARVRKDGHDQRSGRSSSWITKHKRLAIYLRDGFACAYCGVDLRGRSRRDISLDHLICRDHGGSNHESNLVTACAACNCGRSARIKWHRYATPGAVKRIRLLVRRKLNIVLAKAIIAGDARNEAAESLR